MSVIKKANRDRYTSNLGDLLLLLKRGCLFKTASFANYLMKYSFIHFYINSKKMKNKLPIFSFSLVLSLLFICACSPKDKKDTTQVKSDAEIYIDKIQQFRHEKDSALKYDVEHSPILEEERNNFNGLNYFPVDTKYYIIASFRKYKNPDTLKIFTTKPDDIRTMLRYGEFSFKIDGKEYKLQGYVNVPLDNPVYVFLPFTDLTTSEDTYEGGRYLDITMHEGETTTVLDFNLAYNPYCAYNTRYSCPLVPMENFLKTKILGGEKTYKKH